MYVRVRELLTPEELLQYLQIPSDLGEWELGTYFTFTQHDLEIIQQRLRQCGQGIDLYCVYHQSRSDRRDRKLLIKSLSVLGLTIFGFFLHQALHQESQRLLWQGPSCFYC
jgi:hypothetical protein